MRAIRTSGLMSGDGKRGDASVSVLAPILDSTNYFTSNGRTGFTDRNAVTDAVIVERVRAGRPG